MCEFVQDLSVEDFSKLTGVHPETIRRQCRLGTIVGAYKVGRQWIISRNAIERIRGGAITEEGGT